MILFGGRLCGFGMDMSVDRVEVWLVRCVRSAFRAPVAVISMLQHFDDKISC